MSVIKSDGIVGIGKQTAFGTEVAPSVWLRVTNAQITVTPVGVDIEETGDRDSYDYEPTGFDHTFTVTAYLSADEDFHQVLAWSLMNIVSETGTTPTTHVVKPKGSALVAADLLTIWLDRGVVLSSDQAVGLRDSVIETVTLACDTRGVATIEFSGRGCVIVEDSALTASFNDPERYKWSGYTLSIADYPGSPSQLSPGGRFSCTWNNNPDFEAFDPGSVQPDMPELGRFDCNFEIEKRMVATDPLYDALIGETRQNVRAVLARTVGVVGYSVQVDINAAQVTEMDLPEVSGDSTRGMIRATFRGRSDSSESSLKLTMADEMVNYG